MLRVEGESEEKARVRLEQGFLNLVLGKGD